MAEHPDLIVSPKACHIDVGFVLHVDNPDAPVLWDCASGFGTSDAAARESAVRAWSLTTAPVVLELINHQGEFAEHYDVTSPEGLPGRHTIHGAILGWGFGEGPDALQSWWLAHPLLPSLGPTLEPELGPLLSTVRVFFGSQAGRASAEVRVDGRSVPAADQVLLGMDWPRSDDVAYVRAFALTMPHRD